MIPPFFGHFVTFLFTDHKPEIKLTFDGLMDGWMRGWMDGCMHGWTDGWPVHWKCQYSMAWGGRGRGHTGLSPNDEVFPAIDESGNPSSEQGTQTEMLQKELDRQRAADREREEELARICRRWNYGFLSRAPG